MKENEFKQVWSIATLDCAPAMTDSVVDFTGTFQAAVDFARQSFATTARRTLIRSGSQSFASFWWFRIAKDGEENRNTNSHIA